MLVLPAEPSWDGDTGAKSFFLDSFLLIYWEMEPRLLRVVPCEAHEDWRTTMVCAVSSGSGREPSASRVFSLEVGRKQLCGQGVRVTSHFPLTGTVCIPLGGSCGGGSEVLALPLQDQGRVTLWLPHLHLQHVARRWDGGVTLCTREWEGLAAEGSEDLLRAH